MAGGASAGIGRRPSRWHAQGTPKSRPVTPKSPLSRTWGHPLAAVLFRRETHLTFDRLRNPSRLLLGHWATRGSCQRATSAGFLFARILCLPCARPFGIAFYMTDSAKTPAPILAAGGILLRVGRRPRIAIVRLRREKSWV